MTRKEAEGVALAWVGEEPVTLSEVVVGRAPKDRERRRALVELAIDDRLVAQEARKRGLHQKGGLAAQIARIRREARRAERALLREALVDDLAASARVTEGEIEDHYAEAPDQFTLPFYRVRVARFDAHDEAAAVKAALDAGEVPGPVLFERLGPGQPRSFPAPIRELVTRGLGVGERAVTRGDEGWWMAEVLSIEQAPARNFGDVRGQVRRSASRQRTRAELDALLERLRSETPIERVEAALDDERLWSAPVQ